MSGNDGMVQAKNILSTNNHLFFLLKNSLSFLIWGKLLVYLPGIEKPAVVTKMNLTLSADHRVFDSDVGGNLFC